MIKKIILLLFVFSIARLQPLSAQGLTPPTIKDMYPKKIGNLRFSAIYLYFHNLKNNTSKTDTIKIYNEWNKPMDISFVRVPAYLKFTAVPSTLKSGAAGLIICTYDATKKNDYGFMIDRVEIPTNDTIQKSKALSINAEIEEYFPSLSPADSANAQRSSFKETVYEFGTIKEGLIVHHDFTITNIGKKPLLIHKAKPSCGCTTAHLEKNTLAPGESTILKIDFNSNGQNGKEEKTVTVICNDPFQPVTIITMKGEVTK